MNTSAKWVFASWATLTVLAGSILTSFHQPFEAPTAAILKLAERDANKTRAVHILAASCGCSQRVMQHLTERRPIPALDEQVLILDGPAPDLPHTDALVAGLTRAGFAVHRLPSASIPPEAALRGVPLLIFAAPDDTILYMGGYGPAFDQDTAIYAQLQQKHAVQPLAAIGCAISKALQRQVDPLHLKY